MFTNHGLSNASPFAQAAANGLLRAIKRPKATSKAKAKAKAQASAPVKSPHSEATA